MYLAGRVLQRPLPENPAWWTLFDTTTGDLVNVCNTLAWLYTQPKPTAPELELIKVCPCCCFFLQYFALHREEAREVRQEVETEAANGQARGRETTMTHRCASHTPSSSTWLVVFFAIFRTPEGGSEGGEAGGGDGGSKWPSQRPGNNYDASMCEPHTKLQYMACAMVGRGVRHCCLRGHVGHLP